MEFEWDEAKRQSNIQKHGVDFVDVPSLFDGYIVTMEDTRFVYAEPRFITIGIIKGRTIIVVHTERREKIRIISARKATQHEEISYFKQVTNQLETPRRARRRGH